MLQPKRITTKARRTQRILYLVTIRNVREVTLAGTADAAFWREQLDSYGLVPYLIDGRAQLAVGGTALRWLGFAFRELTVSVAVSTRPDGSSNDGWFLAAAVNTSPMLAAMERSMFQTPYVPGELRVEASERPCVELRETNTVRLLAQSSARDPIPKAVDGWWEGPIFLPRLSRARTAGYFRARLGGPMTSYAWDAAGDSFELAEPYSPPVRQLASSAFEPLEWRIRTAATHARSKTLKRP